MGSARAISDSDSGILRERKFSRGLYHYTIRRVADTVSNIEYLRERHRHLEVATKPAEQRERRDLARRIKAFNRREWQMIGVVVEISIETQSHWVEKPVVGRAALWSIESDSGEAYLQQIEEEVLGEALEDIDNLRAALAT